MTGVTPAGPVNARYLQIRPTGHRYRSARRTVLWKRMAIDGERERNCDPAQFINACGARCAEQRNTKNECGGNRSKFWTRLAKRGFRVLRGKSGRSVAHNCSIRFDSRRASVTMALCDRAGTPRRFNRTVRMAMVRDGVTWRAPCNLPGESTSCWDVVSHSTHVKQEIGRKRLQHPRISGMDRREATDERKTGPASLG